MIKQNQLKEIYGLLYKEIYGKIYGENKLFQDGRSEQVNKKNTIFGSQQDSQELLLYIINNTFDSNTFDPNFFSFSLDEDIYCSKNGVNSNLAHNNEKCVFLVLPVTTNYINPIKNSLSELIKYFETDEKLTVNYQLQRCINNGKDTHKRFNIKIPSENKYLFIQLNRLLKNFKINVELYFDKDINIEYQLYINNYRYDLIGVILRNGSYSSGHYIYATIKNNKIHKVYDDEGVYDNLRMWSDLKKHAYVLLYRKHEKKIIH